MKEGWEYKKLGEVAEIIGGSTPKTDIPEYWEGDNYWVTPAELDGSKYIEKTQRAITQKAIEKTNLSLLPIGTVLLSSRAPIGKLSITKSPMYCNQGFKNIVCGESLYNEFVYYYLKNNVDYLQSLGTGATFKEISKKVVEKIEIPVPSITEQKQIVSELDLLSEVIEKQKAQLAELDKLAQSIFYDMFGNPVTNEKGWNISPLENIVADNCTISYGIVQPGEEVEDGIPVVRPVDMVNSIVYKKGLKVIDKSISDSYKRTLLEGGELLFCVRGTTGIMSFAADELKGCNVTRGITPLSFNNNTNKYYVYYFLSTSFMKAIIAERTRGITLKQINMKDVRLLPIYCPPLSLQQEFAAKVEAIEAMKAKVRLSLKETETLFNSRMDYYFN